MYFDSKMLQNQQDFDLLGHLESKSNFSQIPDMLKQDQRVMPFWGRLTGRNADAPEPKSQKSGWADFDQSDYESDEELRASDEEWTGMRRPGSHDSEEYSTEEGMDDEWDNDSDDDDHGGHMMPIPGF